MRHTVELPKLGDTAAEVVVLEWLVEEGRPVSAGDPVLRVETDKIVTELVAPMGGVLATRLVEEDDEVATGAPIFVIATADE